jgi:hypothetical protein
VAVIGQFFEVNPFVTNMLVAMGLALGIDYYSLFIVSRLREERGKGLAHGEAILNVSSTATRAVVAERHRVLARPARHVSGPDRDPAQPGPGCDRRRRGLDRGRPHLPPRC